MARRRGIRLVEHGVFGIELADRRDAPLGVSLAEHPHEVRLHEALVIDGSFRRNGHCGGLVWMGALVEINGRQIGSDQSLMARTSFNCLFKIVAWKHWPTWNPSSVAPSAAAFPRRHGGWAWHLPQS